MPRKAVIPIVMVTIVGLLSAPAASGADRRLQVEPSATRSVVAALLDKSKKAKIQLKDGTTLSGTVIGASEPGLLFEIKKRVQVLPYDQLSTVRLDLGPNRGWQGAGAALGVVGGIAGGLRLAFGSDNSAAGLAGVAIVFATPFLGGKLLGDLHRNWLIIEVH